MRWLGTVTIIVWISSTNGLYAQSLETTQGGDTRNLELLFELLAQRTGISPQLDLIELYAAQPLNLRRVRSGQLAELPSMTLPIARRITALARRSANMTIEDIRDSLQLDEVQYLVLVNCTTMSVLSQSSRRRISSARTTSAQNGAQTASAMPLEFLYRVRSVHRLNIMRGTETGRFAGNQHELYQRLDARTVLGTTAIRASLLVDKDPGEASYTDYITGGVEMVFGTEQNTKILVGDYSVMSGLGSIVWQANAPGKGVDVISPAMQFGVDAQLNRSVLTAQVLRGAAVHHRHVFDNGSSLTALMWGSLYPRSGRIDTARNVITSFYTEGLYRTESEIERRNSLSERAWGTTLKYEVNRLIVGGTIFSLNYDMPSISTSSSAIEGHSALFASVFATAMVGDWFVAGELAKDGGNKVGGRISATTRALDDEWTIGLRAFPDDFRSPFGVNFGQSSRPTDEAGLYVGWGHRFSRSVRLYSYLDVFSSSAPNSPVGNHERDIDIFSEVQWQSTPKTLWAVRTRFTTGNNFTRIGSSRIPVYDEFLNSRWTFRAEVQHTLNDDFRLRTRMETVYRNFDGNSTPEAGMLWFGDIVWSPHGSSAQAQLRITTRFLWYSTGSFDAAIWAFEPSIPGTLVSPAFQGRGGRTMLMVQYMPNEWINLYVSGYMSARIGASSLGSDLTAFSGNVERRVTLQADIRW